MSTLLFITPRYPWPLTKGDQLRAYNQIKYLSESYEIVLFSISEEKVSEEWINEIRPYCKSIEIFYLSRTAIFFAGLKRMTSKLPFQSIYHFNNRAAAKLKELYLLHTPEAMLFQLIRMVPYAKFFPPEICIIDLMDCFSYHYLLRGRHSSISKSWFYNLEYRRVKRYEQYVLATFKKITVISKKDKELLPGSAEHVTIVPNGVQHFQEVDQAERQADLVFLGNLSYEPNIAAARFIALRIMPLLNRRSSKVKLIIAGKDPGRQILKLRSENIEVLGNVKEIYPVLRSASIFVAPMFLSTGVQNKILEAMSAGLIVITSPNAADAIGAIPGKHLLIAISADQFANQVMSILRNPADFESIREAAYSLLDENFMWKSNVSVMNRLISMK